ATAEGTPEGADSTSKIVSESPPEAASLLSPNGSGSAPAGVATATQTAPEVTRSHSTPANGAAPLLKISFTREDLHAAIELVRQFDPPGVACRDLRECLLYQLRYHQSQLGKNGNGTVQQLADAIAIVDQHLRALQNRQHKEIARAINRPIEAVPAALEY